LETCKKLSNAAIESLNIDGRIINNEQHIADTFNNYFLSIADNIYINNNNNNNNTHIQNKYNHNADKNNSPLQSVSQIHKSADTKIKQNQQQLSKLKKK